MRDDKALREVMTKHEGHVNWRLGTGPVTAQKFAFFAGREQWKFYKTLDFQSREYFLRRETTRRNAFAAIKINFPRSPVFHFFRPRNFRKYLKIRTKSADSSPVLGTGVGGRARELRRTCGAHGTRCGARRLRSRVVDLLVELSAQIEDSDAGTVCERSGSLRLPQGSPYSSIPSYSLQYHLFRLAFRRAGSPPITPHF
jgi:hypothetical protein